MDVARVRSNIGLYLKKESNIDNVIKEYKEYSVKNKIYFKEDKISTKKLFEKCNLYHQHYLLYKNNGGRGTKIKTKCYKNNFYDEFYMCDGWYTNEKRCGYVKWYWDEEDTDYTNLHHINISYTRPSGNPEKC